MISNCFKIYYAPFTHCCSLLWEISLRECILCRKERERKLFVTMKYWGLFVSITTFCYYEWNLHPREISLGIILFVKSYLLHSGYDRVRYHNFSSIESRVTTVIATLLWQKKTSVFLQHTGFSRLGGIKLSIPFHKHQINPYKSY